MPPRKSAASDEAKKNVLLEARNAATRRLIEKYKPEFESLYVEEASARGVEYKPELTPEQKREEILRKLLEEDPGLLQRFDPTGGLVSEPAEVDEAPAEDETQA